MSLNVPLDANGNIKATFQVKDTNSGLSTSLNSKPLSIQPSDTDEGLISMAVIHGKTTAGGGTYVDVKVTPSGALNVAPTDTEGSVAPGTAGTSSNLVGAVFNTTAPAPTNGQQTAIQSDAAGNLYITIEGRKATYRAAGVGATLATSNSYLLIGSATKKVKLVRIEVNVNSTSTGLVQLLVKKYSTNPTGGTITAITAVPNDSTDSAATGIFRQYTVAPTEGTLVGAIGSWVIAFPINSSASFANPINVLNFSAGAGEKPITLNNANECIGINFNASVFGNVSIIWTEE